jgi:mono/diheme cytochrome c family protein
VESSQREATVVAIGLVIIATLVVIYLFNEPHRRNVMASDKVTESADRGVVLFAQYCVPCHGPDGKATGRIGIPLNTAQNQEKDTAKWDLRRPVLDVTIHRGRGNIMPAWGQTDGGPLNEEQIEDLINLIHTGAWDKVEALVLKENGGVLPTPPPAPTPAGGAPADPQAAAGQQLYSSLGCQGCHTVDGSQATGPTWKGLYGAQVELEGGTTVTADDAYIHESIVNPTAKVVKGFPPIMPSFEGRVTDDQITQIIAYIKSLK